MRTLLAHEWLAPTGGSENVFEQLRLTLPDHDAVCLWNDDPVRFPQVGQSFLARTPLRRHKAAALPLMPAAWRRVDLARAERVVVSSHAFAHHLASRAAERDIAAYAYIHTPARYLWNPELDERGNHRLARIGRGALQRFDRSRSSSHVAYAANSQFVAARIRDAWGTDAIVIPPPVEIEKIRASGGDAPPSEELHILDEVPELFVLGASRFVEYKRLDSAIEVGEKLDLPVVLAGSGPDEERLRHRAARATVPVRFVGRISTPLLWELYRRAGLYVFTAVEDFGIMPVEAMAAGTPVVVNRVGGAMETVQSTGGGSCADPDDGQDLASAAVRAMGIDMAAVASSVDQFAVSRFRQRVQDWVAEAAPMGRQT